MHMRREIILVSNLSLIADIVITQAVSMNLFNTTQDLVQEATEELLCAELSG
jgi:hypothetical protein